MSYGKIKKIICSAKSLVCRLLKCFRLVFTWDRFVNILIAGGTIGLAFFTYGLYSETHKLVVDGYGFATGQLYIMQGQLNEMETDKRPWIESEVSIVKPIISQSGVDKRGYLLD